MRSLRLWVTEQEGKQCVNKTPEQGEEDQGQRSKNL